MKRNFTAEDCHRIVSDVAKKDGIVKGAPISATAIISFVSDSIYSVVAAIQEGTFPESNPELLDDILCAFKRKGINSLASIGDTV